MDSKEAWTDWPEKREKATGARVKLKKAGSSVWFPNEATVTFALGEREYHGWMPDYAVNITNRWLKAFIVGDYDNGDWEILLPNETTSSTDLLRVPRKEQGQAVQIGWW